MESGSGRWAERGRIRWEKRKARRSVLPEFGGFLFISAGFRSRFAFRPLGSAGIAVPPWRLTQGFSSFLAALTQAFIEYRLYIWETKST
jgi:hypothetical protein